MTPTSGTQPRTSAKGRKKAAIEAHTTHGHMSGKTPRGETKPPLTGLYEKRVSQQGKKRTARGKKISHAVKGKKKKG